VVVVSHAFRKSHMPAAREPAGEKIALDGRGYTVIGVMPEEFDFPLATEMWVPLALSPEDKARRDVANLAVLGRLKAGVSAERARAELAALAATLEKRYPRTNAGRGVEIWPLGSINDITDRFVLILAFAAGFVLLLACANIGNLQLARFTARQKEMGLRAALGASRFRLVRQLLTESLVISAAGGVAGLWLGTWELGLLKAAIPAEILRWVGGLKHLQMDPGVLAFSFGLSLAAGAGCCLPSIYQLLRRRQGDGVSEALKEAGRGYTSSRAGNRARTALVSTEVALALILLVGAGLMVRTFDRMLTVNDGFDPRGLLTLEVTPSPNAYREGTQKAQYYTRALAEMGTLAGVEAAAASGGIGATKWEIEGREAPAPAEPRPGAWAITPKYFQAMRIPIVEGRPIAEQDGPRRGAQRDVGAPLLAELVAPRAANPAGRSGLALAHGDRHLRRRAGLVLWRRGAHGLRFLPAGAAGSRAVCPAYGARPHAIGGQRATGAAASGCQPSHLQRQNHGATRCRADFRGADRGHGDEYRCGHRPASRADGQLFGGLVFRGATDAGNRRASGSGRLAAKYSADGAAANGAHQLTGARGRTLGGAGVERDHVAYLI
jgi:predicted permease